MTRTYRRSPALLALGLTLLSPLAAHAGRPLSTDNAGTAPAGGCEVESWLEQQSGQRAWIVTPACGLVEGLQVSASVVLPHPRDPVRAGAGLAVKWAPASARVDTPAGDLALGLAAGTDFERQASAGWRRSSTALWGLASLNAAPSWSLDLNVGVVRDAAARTQATHGNLALSWTPDAHWLAFGETLVNSRRDVFGGRVTAIGARRWLVPERFGIDLTTSRESGASANVWTVGFGWYGLGL
jgi:hypothetical protein